MKLGFIGTGVMGRAITEHLMNAGHEVTVYNRTKAKTDELVKKGAIWAETPKDVTKNSEIIFSMVGYPQDEKKFTMAKMGSLQRMSKIEFWLI